MTQAQAIETLRAAGFTGYVRGQGAVRSVVAWWPAPTLRQGRQIPQWGS